MHTIICAFYLFIAHHIGFSHIVNNTDAFMEIHVYVCRITILSVTRHYEALVCSVLVIHVHQ